MKGNLIVYFIALVAFGFIWWGMKEILDIFCTTYIDAFAVQFNISEQEAAWWGVVPILLFVIVVTGLTVRFLRGRQKGG